MNKQQKEFGNSLIKMGGALIIVILVLVGIYLFALPDEVPPDPVYYIEIDRDDIKNQNVTGFTMVDTRNETEYETRHIGGALNMPWGCGSCYVRSITENFSYNDTIVLYGYDTQSIATFTHGLGFRNLYVFTDWRGWIG